MENQMEKNMENEMETTIMGYIGIMGYMLGLYWDNGKENGSYRGRLKVLPGNQEWIRILVQLYNFVADVVTPALENGRRILI